MRVRPLRKRERLEGQHVVVHAGSDSNNLSLQKRGDPKNPYLSSGKAVTYHYKVHAGIFVVTSGRTTEKRMCGRGMAKGGERRGWEGVGG